MNRDFEKVCDHYIGALIDSIVQEHGVCGKELHGIWHTIKRPKKDRPQRCSGRSAPLPPPSVAEPSTDRALHALKDEDLRRHCVRNGILPPTQREDMIRVLSAVLMHP